MSKPPVSIPLFALCAGVFAWIANDALRASEPSHDWEHFETRVRPVLELRCVSCHGEDRLGGLDLSSRAGVLAGGDSGPAIALGDPEASLLIQAVRHQLPQLRMPMTGPKLTSDEITALADWIRSGAPWPHQAAAHIESEQDPTGEPPPPVTDEDRSFWSYQPLRSVEVAPEGVGREIDWFVEKELTARGLVPLPRSSKQSLLRRVTFDLTGLPPSPEEIEAFLEDQSKNAFALVVDRLLASPHYGERWGRRWLDVARYGEDDARTLAEDDSGRERYANAYVYRDWVIEAFNQDLPFERFVEAQLAADLLPEPERTRSLGGLGFLGIGPWFYDTAEAPIARADERHDRVDVTTRAFLGLTVGCARCHDHKYDAIPITDYYALAGIFANTEYHEYPIGTPEELTEDEKRKRYRKDLREARKEFSNTESRQLARRLTHQVKRYMMGAWKVTGEPAKNSIDVANEDRLDLELLERFVRFTQKKAQHYPHLLDWQRMIAEGGDDEQQKARAEELAARFQRQLLELVVKKGELEEHNEYLIARGSDLPPRERKSTPMPNEFESFFDLHQLELETLDNESMRLYQDVYDLDLDLTEYGVHYEPGLLRFWGWTAMRQLDAASRDHIEALDDELEELYDPEKQLPFVMGVRDRGETEIADLPLHLRGSPKNLGAAVPRHFLGVLQPGEPERYVEGSGRLRLAQQIAGHPLAARVWVNRIWQGHFGEGIVSTESNFGTQGARPTHPDLLEYLGSKFVEQGGRSKALHREILMSDAYQRASRVDNDSASWAAHFLRNEGEDPENHALWRGPRRRLEAEELRDALLAAAGNLDRTIGGPSQSLDEEGNQRRTVYATVSRFEIDPFLQTFDFPNPSISSEGRFVTNVPLQHLWFLNSDFVRRQASAIAARSAKADDLEEDAGPSAPVGVQGISPAREAAQAQVSDEDRLARTYRLLYGRWPQAEETDLALRFLASIRETTVRGEPQVEAQSEVAASVEEGDAAETLDGSAQETESWNPPEEAWLRLVRSLVAANEFRYVE